MGKKNVIYIYADDLGRGMLSCYGQKLIETKNIDRLANTGTKFNNFYATAFCAPSRASLLCGIHDAHAGRWSFTPGGYYKKISTGEVTFEELQEVLQHSHIVNNEYIANVAKRAGYVTGEIGKLEWGFSVTAKQMDEHGWDYHYGYYDHIQCHGFYPPFLFENGKMVNIAGNTDPHCGRPNYNVVYDENYKQDLNMEGRAQYSQDLFDEKIIEFLREHKDERFFLYHPSQLPHGLIFYPEIHEQVKDRDDLTLIEKEYASMVLRLDETVGKIIDEVERLGLREETIIIFASDNGHTIDYVQPERTSVNEKLNGEKTDNYTNPFRSDENGDVFNGNDGQAGLKFSNWNGGCTIPFIASCPEYIPQGKADDTLISNYDTLATIADLVDEKLVYDTDGISYLPILRGEKTGKTHDYVIFSSIYGPAVVTKEGYKLRVYTDTKLLENSGLLLDGVNLNLTNHPGVDYQLFNLNIDREERNNIADEHPEMVKRLKQILINECDGNLLNGTPDVHITYPIIDGLSWEEIVKDKI